MQGGYGKYQGTWIPLSDGRALAEKNGVLSKLQAMFDYVPGDRSPPPAPKHATAASSKPRQPRAPAQARRQPGKKATNQSAANGTKTHAVYAHVPDYDNVDTSMMDGDTPDNVTIASESAFDDFDHQEAHYGGSRKRRRTEDTMSQADKEHQLWADELLDYFMLQDSPHDSLPSAPQPPATADLNRPIDDKGHTALHWAAAMGDIEVVKDLIRRGANIDVQAKNGETPLMRAVVFTNNFDRQNMQKLAGLLIRTVQMQEWFGSTVFHHIANTTERKSKYQCARYYLDCILDQMSAVLGPDGIERVLNTQDQSGDTAITIAARNGARKCVRSLIGRNAAVDIQNMSGETADQLIVQLNHRRQERSQMSNRQMSSSPYQNDGSLGLIAAGGPVQPHQTGVHGNLALDPMLSQSQNGASQAMEGVSDGLRSEAAVALMSSITPVLLNKAKDLANSIDAEIAEKDAELAEAERVAATRRLEIDVLKRQAEELRLKEIEQSVAGEEGDDELLAELEQLMAECEGLTEDEQDYALQELLHQEEQAMQNSLPNGVNLDEAEDGEGQNQNLMLVRELRDLMQQRKNLFKTIVQNLSVAGLGDKQSEYKRLITGALGVREEDVEGMLPEIVAELEDWQLENVSS